MKKIKPKKIRLSISISPDLNNQLIELSEMMDSTKSMILADIVGESVPELYDLMMSVKSKVESGAKVDPVASAASVSLKKLATFFDGLISPGDER